MPPVTKAPAPHEPSFTCPHCGALAQQAWFQANWDQQTDITSAAPDGVYTSVCSVCDESVVWHSELVRSAGASWHETRQIWPKLMIEAQPLPGEAPAAVRELWDEARAVAPVSSRAAAALLRLALQELLTELVPGEGNLNAAIGTALRDGVPEPVQQSMDVLRVGGNSAVHPGEVRLDDDPATLAALFGLLSYVVEETVVRAARIAELFSRLPQEKRVAIEKRDQSPGPATSS